MNFTASEKLNPYNGKKTFWPGISKLVRSNLLLNVSIPIHIVFNIQSPLVLN